jgi:hypothetical protein
MNIEELKIQLKKADANLDKAFVEVKRSIGAEKRKEVSLEQSEIDQELARNNWSKAAKELESIRKQLRELGVKV